MTKITFAILAMISVGAALFIMSFKKRSSLDVPLFSTYAKFVLGFLLIFIGVFISLFVYTKGGM
jgi:hypothetical protein